MMAGVLGIGVGRGGEVGVFARSAMIVLIVEGEAVGDDTKIEGSL